MNSNEIKKALYKEKPEATALHKTYIKGELSQIAYTAELSTGTVFFRVPVEEMGGLIFADTQPAQHLIRWLT